MWGAKVWAGGAGEPTPGVPHVRRVAQAVLGHRLVLNYAATGDRVGAADLVERLLAQVAD